MNQAVIQVHRGGPLVAQVCNPSCGEAALSNLLAGSRQKVANYSGLTVERKEGRLLTAEGKALRMLDFRGACSLNPRSPDERVTCDVLCGRAVGEKRPDLVVCVVAPNMADLAAQRGVKVLLCQRTGRVGAEAAAHRPQRVRHNAIDRRHRYPPSVRCGLDLGQWDGQAQMRRDRAYASANTGSMTRLNRLASTSQDATERVRLLARLPTVVLSI